MALRNGELVPTSSLAFPLDDADIVHGYGCYETLKVRDGVLFLAGRHEERLLMSAAILGIRHAIRPGDIASALDRLARANGLADCNLKLMLIGRSDRDADWYAFALPALHVPEGAAEAGVSCLAYRGERQFPRAKSLSMLLSTIAFRAAASLGCWDALLVNGRGELTEGTRTNLFYLFPDDPAKVYTPPAADVLEGVTRGVLMDAMAASGSPVIERPLPLAEARSGAAALMLTSTSTGIAPVSRLIDGDALELPVPPRVAELRAFFASLRA